MRRLTQSFPIELFGDWGFSGIDVIVWDFIGSAYGKEGTN